MKKHDVIIIGGGPGGSTLASYLARSGVDVAIIERENYPRFHIGESLLPGSMPIFKEIGFYDTLSSGKYIQKFGARFVDYRQDDEVYFGFEGGLNPDIPMAFEVERKHFDQDILNHSVKCGATLYQPERVKEVKFYDSHVELKTTKDEYQAKFVADFSGRDALLGKTLGVRTKHDDLNNVAVFAHFTGVKRNPGKHEGDIIVGLLPDAGWNWIIPFQGDTTSVGVVCNSSVFKAGTDLAEYMTQSLAASPKMHDYTKDAERTSEISIISNYSHHSEKFSGDRWILGGDAAVFLDPIFSSGVHVSVSSARFISKIMTEALKTGTLLNTNGAGEKYETDLLKGVHRFHNLISLFYKSNFVEGMKKTLQRENMRQAFTSAVAGDVWDDENIIFKMRVL